MAHWRCHVTWSCWHDCRPQRLRKVGQWSSLERQTILTWIAIKGGRLPGTTVALLYWVMLMLLFCLRHTNCWSHLTNKTVLFYMKFRGTAGKLECEPQASLCCNLGKPINKSWSWQLADEYLILSDICVHTVWSRLLQTHWVKVHSLTQTKHK